MGDHLTYHRYQWFDRQVRAGRYPNASTLADKFEISTKTAQRCIESIRDRLEVPLEYDSSHKGYFYLDTNFQLPSPDITQEELLARGCKADCVNAPSVRAVASALQI